MKAGRWLLSLLFGCCCAHLAAAEWVRLRLPGEADEHAYDLASVYIFADEVTYWRRIRKAERSAVPGKRLLRERIQCTQHTLTTLTEIEFDPQGQRRAVATPFERAPLQILADTPEATLEQSICRLIGRKSSKMPAAAATSGAGEMTQ